MPSIQGTVAALRNSPSNVRYADLYKVCRHYFGKPRQEKTSHAKFETALGRTTVCEHSEQERPSEALPGEAGPPAIDKLQGKE
jgi:hypothetical protein